MKNPMLCLILLAAATLAGCAHPYSIKPDVAAVAVTPTADGDRIHKNIGLFIPPADRAKLVTTAGGGGDKVRYAPYGDLETGLYKVLDAVFQGVRILTSPSDTEQITKYQLAYIVQPAITTTSSSKGAFTWMPNDFSVTLACKFIEPTSGKSVTTVTATGAGHAPWDDVKANFNVAGERASQDALSKLQTALTQSPELKK